MSGTSLDGISAAAVHFTHARDGGSVPSGCELLAHVVRPYTADQRRRLEAAIEGAPTAREWCQLGFDLGAWLADAANQVIEMARVPRARVRAIASHGQTVWHEPGRSTWQLGEAAVIAELTDLDVVSDFRVRDVAAGGEGAPLVPMADAVLFASPREWRALQNVGGIANATIVPPAVASTDVAVVRAFDTGPGVMVIDGVVRTLYRGLRYDEDGRLARRGRVISGVIDELLRDPYFAAQPPKTTGRERFGAAYVAAFIARCRAASPGAADADLVATAVSLTARSIADAYRRFVPEPIAEVLLSGGGARNPVLVDSLTGLLAPRRVRPFDDLYFDGEAKEAVAFALLGALHLAGLPGNVPTATGARGPRVLGKLTPRGALSASRADTRPR